jgi:hypothetical protein
MRMTAAQLAAHQARIKAAQPQGAAAIVAEFEATQAFEPSMLALERKQRRAQHRSPYVTGAAAYCRVLAIPEPVGEHYFDDGRDWRFDLAWPEHAIALEVDGGIGSYQPSHMSRDRVRASIEKMNAAALAGWRVFHCEPANLALGLQLVRDRMHKDRHP